MVQKCAVVLLLACLLLWPATPARAQTAPAATTPVMTAPVLVPAGTLAFVQMRGLVVGATLECIASQCQVRVEQVYYLHNADKIEGVSLRLGLTGPAQGASALDVALGQVTLVDQKGAPMPPLEGDGVHPALWELPLARDEHRTLTLRYTQALGESLLLHWRLGLDALASWGEIGGLRVTLTLPGAMDETALLRVDPASYAFDRTRLVWDSELWTASGLLTVQMVAPPAWQQLQTLRAGDDYAALAGLYTALAAAGGAMGIALPDYADEILAAWQSAVAARPEDQVARLALARLYQARAAREPAQYLSYSLLAGEQLEALLKIKPGDQAVADEVRALYYEAATLASRAGDPATAMTYLDRAAQAPGAEQQTLAQLEELSLRWAVDLAEQGMVDQALLQLAGRLAPETEDAILRYAPPFVSARTEIDQTPTGRTARYTLELYGPSAERTAERVQTLATNLTFISQYPFAPVVQRAGNTLTVELAVQARTLEELGRVSKGIRAVCTPMEDLVAALLAQPWLGTPETYGIERGLLRSRAYFLEQVDSTSLQVAWDSQAEYVRWRMAELEAMPAETETAQLERRLALIALRDQRFVWDQLPSSTYSVLRVVHWESESGPSWILPWGQARTLRHDAVSYHWTAIALLGAALFVLLLGALRLVAASLARRR